VKSKALWIGLGLVVLDADLVLTRPTGMLVLLLTSGLAIWGLVLLGTFLIRRSRIIWRLRNRLIVTYVFIAVVPTVLLLALVFFGGYLVVGQMAAYLAATALERRADTLSSSARLLCQTSEAARTQQATAIAAVLEKQLPGLEVFVSGRQNFHSPEESKLQAPNEAWRDYTGTMTRDGRQWSTAISRSNGVTAVLMAPVTPEVLETMTPGLGSYLTRPAATSGGAGRAEVDPSAPRSVGAVPPAVNVLDQQVPWPVQVPMAFWDRPNQTRAATFALITTRPSAVLGTVFESSIDFGQNILIAFVVIAAMFAFVQLISLLIGAFMTRTITGAVHNLYAGTLRVSGGDFSTRVPVKGKDQLAELGRSFNEMTEQLEKLVAVAREKERMQSELAIASEVQQKLFPRTAPALRNLSLCGVCEPARTVSGDYYDYLAIPGGRVAMAIGDVAGKGISAALLMASIQSIMRTQLDEAALRHAAPGTRHMVAQLNRQLYASTSSEKYATFFFALYDEASRLFTYTNAGHLQPLLIQGNRATLLEVTGTVVGAFPFIEYGEETVTLGTGDLLVSYTDGVTEPENAYGEEFGIERLQETVQRHQHLETPEIAAKVMESVRQWSGAPELPDDMTILIARGLA